MFRPKLIDCLQGYTSQQLFADLVAGLTVGIVALPLAMAFAIASGVKPEAGIFTAVIAGGIISALGGSRVQIGGPTGAFVVIVYGIIAKYGVTNLGICTIMAGFMLVAMGFAGLGAAIKFIPYPVTMGFTSGIAVMIFSTQVKDFFGLAVDKVPADFVEKVRVLAEHFGTLQWPTVALAATSLLIIVFWPKNWARRVPGSIIALIFGTALVMLFHVPVETIGTRFGGIPQGLPKMHLPDMSWQTTQSLFQPALTIALLAAIESLLSAVVADGMIDDRHDSNQELIAQGLANICSPIFGGIPATGAIARTATNVKNGGCSPVAGITHAITLLVILLIAAPLAKFIPLSTLSAVLVVVAFNMGEWHHFARLPRWPRSDAVVFLAAFGLTVLIDLTVAVEVGMVLAAVLFIKRMSETTQIMAVDESNETEGSHHSLVGKEVPAGVLVFRVFGAFFFGAADKLETALKRAQRDPKVLILRMRKVLAMDATGLNALEDLYEKMHKRGQHLILSGPHTQPYMTMIKAGFIDQIGSENVCPHIEASLERARKILGLPPTPSSDAPDSEKKGLESAHVEVATALGYENKLPKPAAHADNGDCKPQLDGMLPAIIRRRFSNSQCFNPMAESDAQSDPTNRHQLRILYVEGDPFVSQMPIRFLASCHCVVTVVHTAAEAWSQCKPGEDPFDIIIADGDTPGMGGIDLVTKLRAARCPARIFISLATLEDDLVDGYKSLGVTGILKKPLEPCTLHECLGTIGGAENSSRQ